MARQKQGWLKKAIGEMSRLRQHAWGLFGRIIGGRWNAPYVLDSVDRVNYEMARKLYRNEHKDYKLGAGFAKPIVNTIAGFMGVPHFRCADEDAQEVLDKYTRRWVSRMVRTHILALRDGDCYVMLVRPEDDDPLFPGEPRVDYVIIPPEQVKSIEFDPFTRRPTAYTLQGKVQWADGSGATKEYTIIQRYTDQEIQITVEGDAPEGVKSDTQPNKWGFIPIIHFRNEPEETKLYGTSELEAVEPYLKAYHDVMMHALQGSKMHNTPRLKFVLKDVDAFIANNFGEDVLRKYERGEPVKLDLNGHELLILQDGEDASFVEARSATGDAQALLQLLFYCIVDTSEVPEFAFGVHTPSSHASVKEQMPLLIRRVSRKREMFTECWQQMARMVLAMEAKAEGKHFESYDVEITWDAVIERDEREYAETLKTLVDALDTALNGGFISLEAAVDLLQQYIDTMQEYATDDPELPGERERIIRTWIMRRRLEDGEGIAEQLEEIEKELGKKEQAN